MTRPRCAWLLVLAVACGPATPAEEGARLFRDPKLSTSPFNVFSCATCHAVEPGAPGVIPGRFDAGYNLANGAGRESWWGGFETRLLDAINVCLEHFMGGRKLAATEERAVQLYVYLEAASPDQRAPALPLTIVRDVVGPPALAGDARRGQEVWDKGCRRCHGEAQTGQGRNTPRAGMVPGDTARRFGDETAAAVVQKVRHGKFFNVGGIMPLYSREALSDQALADLLAFLGL